MVEVRNKAGENERQKKPIALAITLVLLVASLMLVIMFSAKNIGYKQEIQVLTGGQIVEHFKQIDRKLAYLQSNFSLLTTKEENWDEAARLTSAHSQYLLEDVYEHIAALIETGHDIKPEQFGEQAEQQIAAWHSKQSELMQLLSAAEGLTSQNYDDLLILVQQVDQLKEVAQQFNFKLEGNKNAMIRLSAGFDWMELAEQMQKLATVEFGQ